MRIRGFNSVDLSLAGLPVRSEALIGDANGRIGSSPSGLTTGLQVTEESGNAGVSAQKTARNVADRKLIQAIAWHMLICTQ